MEHPDPAEFATSRRNAMTLTEALKIAKSEVAAISDLPVDGLAKSERLPDGGWAVTLELVESPARMGENDLLSAHELKLDPEGRVVEIARIGRYRREDGVTF